MDLFSLLGGLFQQRQQPAQMAPKKMTEDSIPVYTPQGIMPLSSVEQGQQWQNPQTGYSPTGYTDSRRSFNPGVGGAVNPLFRQYRTGNATLYSPGEGPRTNYFNR